MTAEYTTAFRGRGLIHRETGLITQCCPDSLPTSEVPGL